MLINSYKDKQIMTNTDLDLSADTIDVRDIISRFEELRGIMPVSEHLDEFEQLTNILEELKGQGGDEQWQGDWYPVTLISEIYFVEYAQELCSDIGAVPDDFPSYIEIDWEVTARNIQMDYSEVEIDGLTYYFR
jgi:antirestriction protein